jgi:hypothetical protein
MESETASGVVVDFLADLCAPAYKQNRAASNKRYFLMRLFEA